MKTRSIIGLIGALALIAVFMFWRSSNPPYTIEIRPVARDGTVTYEPQRYEKWNPERNLAGLRQHTRDTICYAVYADGLLYCFSKSGHVYAMAGNENDLPSIFDREWNWSGDPHQFPYYDYSKTSPHVRP